jgi:hypothetical protein
MNLAPENADNIIANLHDEVRRQEKVIAALREAMRRIDRANDNPRCYNTVIDGILREVDEQTAGESR